MIAEFFFQASNRAYWAKTFLPAYKAEVVQKMALVRNKCMHLTPREMLQKLGLAREGLCHGNMLSLAPLPRLEHLPRNQPHTAFWQYCAVLSTCAPSFDEGPTFNWKPLFEILRSLPR